MFEHLFNTFFINKEQEIFGFSFLLIVFDKAGKSEFKHLFNTFSIKKRAGNTWFQLSINSF